MRDPISVVRLSHNETHYAFAAKGTIYVYEINAEKGDKQLLKVRRGRGTLSERKRSGMKSVYIAVVAMTKKSVKQLY